MKSQRGVSIKSIDMKRVGETGIDYTIPIYVYDHHRATVTGGYLMATTQTTYELWYEVRVWAEANGYHFQNFGLPGSHDSEGNLWWGDNVPSNPPSVTDGNKNQPVTMVSWRDTIVWLNALSEMHGFNPVYRDFNNNVIRDSRSANEDEGFFDPDTIHKFDAVDVAIQTDHNGYRLPTSHEWEMAARWKDDTKSTDGSVLVEGRYWTPGSYASGSADSYRNEEATRAVAWYRGASGGDFTRPVRQLLPNDLGIYDMSGNVYEWTYPQGGWSREYSGGSWSCDASAIQVGVSYGALPSSVSNDSGFRFVRNP